MKSREPWLDPAFRCPPGECLRCGASLDAGSHPDGLTPDDGDPTVCVYCASVLVFENGSPRMATLPELVELVDGGENEELLAAIRTVASTERNPAYGRWPNGKGPKPPFGESGVAA